MLAQLGLSRERSPYPLREVMADKGLEPTRRPWHQLPEHSQARQASARSSGFPGLH